MPARRPLTILVASTQRRGAEVFCELLADALRGEPNFDNGWDPELVALTRSDGPSVRASPLTDRRRLGKLDLPTVFSLRRHLRHRRPDVLLAFGSSTLKYAVFATRFLGSRPRLAYASIGEPLYWASTPRRQASYRMLLRQVDLVLSVSERTSSQLRQVLHVPADKLRITPTGVHKSLLQISPSQRNGDFRVLFVGSLSSEKDPLAALEAFARLASSVKARLRMLGAGPLEASLRSRVSELSLDNRVELPGSVEDITTHLAWADVLLLTSQTEGLPAVVLEAGAAALPVVAYDVGGVSEAVTDGVTGRLVRAGGAEGLVAALSSYASNPEEARRAGEAGRRLVASRFTIEASARGFNEALSGL